MGLLLRRGVGNANIMITPGDLVTGETAAAGCELPGPTGFLERVQSGLFEPACTSDDSGEDLFK